MVSYASGLASMLVVRSACRLDLHDWAWPTWLGLTYMTGLAWARFPMWWSWLADPWLCRELRLPCRSYQTPSRSCRPPCSARGIWPRRCHCTSRHL